VAKKVKKWLRFVYDDGTVFPLEISTFTTLRKDVKQVMFHIDRLKDGKHLLIMNESIMPMDEARNMKAKLDRIEVVRESDE
jgi:hypothetical protein